jgi:tetratricopeptide (TPR) repeat protein
VRQFVAQPKVRAAALVLSGRCYERETTPYKALDAIIDALSAYLAHLPIAQASALLPVGVTRLARMFPVLRRVPAIVSWPEVDREEKDPHELRRRAFGALRELLARISLRTPVILCIDDLQWGDIDSAALLGEIMRPPEPPSLLVIATHRAAESEGETVLAALRDARKAYEADAPMHIVSLDPLSFEETVDLALTRLGGSGRANRAIAEAIAAEAQGLPFFVDELVRYLDTNDDTRVVVNLDEAIRARLASLAPSARALLIALCVAGHPLESGVAAAAAGLPDESTALSVLRAGSLVRRSAGPRKDMFEPYHDKVRAVVAASLDAAERATLHGRIANALETRGPSDPEVLFVHVREGGDLARAARYAEAAAVRAEEALAFDRAAALWREALELSGANGEASRVLWEKLASALSSAGRSVDAASAFERACDSAPAARALDLRRLAAEHLLRGGAIVEGIRASHEVLRSVGLSLPTTAFRTLLSIAWQTVRMRLRGFAFAARDESLVSPFVLAKADACWSVGASLAVVLPVTARLMQIEMVRLALDAGETRRVARSIGLLIATEIRGTRALAFSRRLIQIATPLVAQAKQPELEAWLAATIGIASYLRGEFQEARPRIEEAVEAFRVTCVGKLWEQANLAIFRGWTLFQLGELDELHRHVSRATQEASQRGDRYLATNIRLGVMNSVWLASDEPDRARTEVDLALANWGSNEVQVQVWHELLARAQADLYERKGDAALARIEATWDTLRRAHLFRIQIVASQAYHLLGRALLASKGGVLDKTARRSLAAARAIEKEGMPAATGWSAALRAGSFHAMGDVARARTELTRAAGGFDAHGMKLWSLAARRRVASLDDAPTTEIDARMQALGVRDTGRMTDCLVPGFAKR